MNVIGKGSSGNSNSIIEQKYIERVLSREAASIIEDQNRVLARFNPSGKQSIISKRRYTIKGSTNLEFTHAMSQRFIDMRRLRGQKKTPIPIHNKIIYTHFNNIINQMAFGLTDDIRQMIAKEYNIEL
ncbi:hypothetical protein ES692_06195 [Psychroserpens burtonensis]|uniref:Uncharacterized protein n=1 Tax=Psychroserpens burtonensis TaxID=49278 RepID=A0A5C7BI41_9FLAO|nr:hypothetical protein [Psychroserpens burtonensis]TXE18632.1 hypothetical protein ES692_06195 [Psychroserpens burtonensis]